MSWFESWFNSPWYHILYDHRDEQEAEMFLEVLLDYLQPAPGNNMLDLGCGKGRHSLYLNQKGYNVTGIDLSPESIMHCRQSENETLNFFVHDMRHLFRTNDFDYVFNLFTSFGYFDTDHEHQAAIANAALALKPGGTLVIDFLNTSFVKKHLIPHEVLLKGGITFEITRSVESKYFVKDIGFTAHGTLYRFQEKVAALELNDFQRYLSAAGMNIRNLFGNYKLEPWNEQRSNRLIIVATKPS